MTIVRPSLFGDCVIYVNDASVDPSSTHLFALLLILAIDSERRTHRSDLQRLLFAPDIEPQQASHNLRQLLYRARRLGSVVDETAIGLRLKSGSVVAYEERLDALTSGGCELLDGASIAFLPAYYPRLPSAFLEWLDCQRSRADNSIRTRLRVASTRLRGTHSWSAVHRVSSVLLTLDPHSEETVAAVAESLAMLNRRDEALLLIASFGAAAGPQASTVGSLRALRARIARLGEVKPEVILRGRDECFAYLDAQWANIGCHGARRAALVGAAGIGKTRLAEAFATRIGLHGAHVTRYSCTPASSHQPLGLFSDIIPELLRLRGSIGASPDYASALNRLRPMAARAGIDGLFDISVEAVRTQVQRALIDLLEAVSDERPILLFVDDAQYLDPVSTDVVRSLSAGSNTAQLLVLLCIRRSHLGSPLLEQSKRGNAYVLEPLLPDESRQIVLDVAGTECAQEHITWCVLQAAGNPYYLHTLASQPFSDAAKVPFDIRSLASNTYSSLSASGRSVLDTCLLLGRLASIDRVTRISAVADSELIFALRELEAVELIQFGGGLLSGPHALLHDALRALIPSSVAALIHTRIATLLEKECVVEHYAFPLAWAAAQSWLAAGDPHSASKAVRECARQAALVGEPTAAASLLSVIVDASLPPALHAELLDELMDYAEAAGSQSVLASALRTRHKLACALENDQEKLRDFELRIVEADLMNGSRISSAIKPLRELLGDCSASPSTRARAAVRLMAIADQELDRALAQRVFAQLPELLRASAGAGTSILRAEVVFHTFCGDQCTARKLAGDLLAQFPQPSSKLESIRARNFAAYALFRLRDLEAAAEVFSSSYMWMMEHGIYNQALYSGSIRTEISIAAGDFEAAKQWMALTKSAVRGGHPHELSPSAGLYSNESYLAMREGRYDDAERLILAPTKDFAVLSTARYKAVALAMSVRLQQMRGATVQSSDVSTLEGLYAKGRELGGQDLIVEALWSARVLANDANGASELLRDYLTSRREISEPDWSLKHTACADDAWLSA